MRSIFNCCARMLCISTKRREADKADNDDAFVNLANEQSPTGKSLVAIDDWILASMVVDRACCVIFAIVFVIMTCAFFIVSTSKHL